MTAPLPDDHDDLLTLTPERIVYTLVKAAKKLETSRTTLARLFDRGEIGGYTIGSRRYFTRADLDDYIARGHAACPAAKKAEPAPCPEGSHVHLMRRTGT